MSRNGTGVSRDRVVLDTRAGCVWRVKEPKRRRIRREEGSEEVLKRLASGLLMGQVRLQSAMKRTEPS